MTEQPKTPRDLAKRKKPNYRAMAELFEQRARRPDHDAPDRARLAAEAERFREMAKIQEEAEEAIKHRKPPAPSV